MYCPTPLSEAAAAAGSRPLDFSRIPNTLSTLCYRLASATGAAPQSVLFSVLVSTCAAAGSSACLAVGPARSRASAFIAEVAQANVSHQYVSSIVSAALDDACKRCGKAPMSVNGEFAWGALPYKLQVRALLRRLVALRVM